MLGQCLNIINRGYLFFFSVKDRNLFHLVNTIGNIFTSGAATRENITDGVHSMKLIPIFHRKKKYIYMLGQCLNIINRGYLFYFFR